MSFQPLRPLKSVTENRELHTDVCFGRSLGFICMANGRHRTVVSSWYIIVEKGLVCPGHGRRKALINGVPEGKSTGKL